ncbi:hypothetical protein NEMIN01_1563 [Nematocida minor]|uniref:uncharacterized protein n=1 Tax=Nematocida minor TaxID=1912983 RepID=UPI00221F0A6A|nr:uncharacterized protein NEMIN01_1563 [Nematocida minor]KAI5191537.1 hypothetical protein NEMIN01_1563 [Nematocida minor]
MKEEKENTIQILLNFQKMKEFLSLKTSERGLCAMDSDVLNASIIIKSQSIPDEELDSIKEIAKLSFICNWFINEAVMVGECIRYLSDLSKEKESSKNLQYSLIKSIKLLNVVNKALSEEELTKLEIEITDSLGRAVNEWYGSMCKKDLKDEQRKQCIKDCRDLLYVFTHHIITLYIPNFYDLSVYLVFSYLTKKPSSFFTLEELYAKQLDGSYLIDEGMKYVEENKEKILELYKLLKDELEKKESVQLIKHAASLSMDPDDIKLLCSINIYRENISMEIATRVEVIALFTSFLSIEGLVNWDLVPALATKNDCGRLGILGFWKEAQCNGERSFDLFANIKKMENKLKSDINVCASLCDNTRFFDLNAKELCRRIKSQKKKNKKVVLLCESYLAGAIKNSPNQREYFLAKLQKHANMLISNSSHVFDGRAEKYQYLRDLMLSVAALYTIFFLFVGISVCYIVSTDIDIDVM